VRRQEAGTQLLAAGTMQSVFRSAMACELLFGTDQEGESNTAIEIVGKEEIADMVRFKMGFHVTFLFEARANLCR
jgi:hypothetical protein